MKNLIRTTLYLSEDLHIAVKVEAAKRRTSMTKLFVQSLKNELSRPREASRKG